MDRKQAVRSDARQTDARQFPRRSSTKQTRPCRDGQSAVRSHQRVKPRYSSAASARTNQSAPSLYLLFRLFRRHLLLIWLVAASLLVGMATAAIMSIVDPTASVAPPTAQSPISTPAALPDPVTPDPVMPDSVTQAPAAAQTPIVPPVAPSLPDSPTASSNSVPSQATRSTEPSPLSAGGLLLLSCAGGCFLLSQCLKPQPDRRHLRRRSSRSSMATNAELTQAVSQSDRPQAAKQARSTESAAANSASSPIDSPIDYSSDASTEQATPAADPAFPKVRTAASSDPGRPTGNPFPGDPRSNQLPNPSFNQSNQPDPAVHHPSTQPNQPDRSSASVAKRAAMAMIQEPLGRLIDQTLESMRASPVAVEVVVETEVLPADQSHPLDWDEPSLADSLDLRQRRPLSDWL